MERYETIWTFKTAQFTIEYSVAPDNGLDLSWDDDGSVRADLERGNLVAFVARVRVLWHGRELGADYLGGCVYKSAEEFIDHRGRNAGGYGSYFSDMVREAIRYARKTAAEFRSIPLHA